jgi:ribosomal protein S18 acetylase RimI-like enzyme
LRLRTTEDTNVPDGFVIRSATEKEFARVLALWEAAAADPTVTDTHESLRRLFRTDDQALLVADIDGEVVGSVIAAWNGWRGSLYRLAVHPRCRRRGLATALVREAERRLSVRGAVRIDAIVTEGDMKAVRFWIATGYAHQQRRLRFVRNL